MKREFDYYTKKARQEGYPSRSVFKLKEIVKKYSLLKNTWRVLDIGACPGGFSTYLLECLSRKGFVVAVDKSPQIKITKKINNFYFINGDIFSAVVLNEIARYAPYDLIVSDAAPATTGTKELDSLKSIEIARRVFDIALQILKKGGNLVVKIFQGGEEQELLARMRCVFFRVKGFKPRSSRKQSFETYYICLSFNTGF